MPFFNSENPLGLPPGSLRGIVFLAVIGTLLYGFNKGLDINNLESIATLILGFYFGSKVNGG